MRGMEKQAIIDERTPNIDPAAIRVTKVGSDSPAVRADAQEDGPTTRVAAGVEDLNRQARKTCCGGSRCDRRSV